MRSNSSLSAPMYTIWRKYQMECPTMASPMSYNDKRHSLKLCPLDMLIPSLAGGLHRRVLVGAEAQQRRDPPDAVKFLVVSPDVHDLDTVADGMSHDGV